MTTRSRLARGAACLLLGAALTIAGAWAAPNRVAWGDMATSWVDMAGAPWPRQVPERWPAPDRLMIKRAAGFVARCYITHVLAPTAKSSTHYAVYLYESGWPFKALRAEVWSEFTVSGSPIVHRREGHPEQNWWRSGVRTRWAELQFPLQPIAAGFLANSLIYGLPLWLGWSGLVVLRRTRRRRRGLCLICGYPAGAGGVCSECGGAVDPVHERAAAPVS